MVPSFPSSTRRNFLAGSARAGVFAGAPILASNTLVQAFAPVQSASGQTGNTPARAKQPPLPQTAPPYDKATINLIGPKSGYSPQVGTIVTMLTWMELAILGPTRGLSQQDLDFLLIRTPTRSAR